MAAGTKVARCALCGRVRKLGFHHFIPRTVHSNKWFKKNFTREEMQTAGVDLCRDCHDFLHEKWSAKELARELNSLEKLRGNEDVAKFVKWVRKKKT
jgi:hypothetical protein